MVLLSRINLSQWLRIWLAAVPVAILAALLATELLIANGQFVGAGGIAALIAIAVVLVICARTQSLMGAVIGGVLTIALLRAF